MNVKTIRKRQRLATKREVNRKAKLLGDRIDPQLPEHPTSGREVIIPFDFDEGPDFTVRQKIIKKYSKRGWLVTYHPDSRDGDYFKFHFR